jgi:Uma2 family endonuclease
MSAALQPPSTAAAFLAWLGGREERYEFDGLRPVAMTGGNARHNRIVTNIHAALRTRLRGTPCAFFGPDLGVRTIGERVRFPDALITCARFPDTAELAPDVRVIFEVLSPTSGRTDRIVKVQEYAAIASMRRYVIVESRFPGVLVLHRMNAGDAWTALALTAEELLDLPEAGATVAIADFYEDVDFSAGLEAD